jgi:hypothetical protein
MANPSDQCLSDVDFVMEWQQPVDVNLIPRRTQSLAVGEPTADTGTEHGTAHTGHKRDPPIGSARVTRRGEEPDHRRGL